MSNETSIIINSSNFLTALGILVTILIAITGVIINIF